jgi:hypothetical protein
VLVLSPFLIREVERGFKYPRIQALYKLDDDAIQQHIDYLQSFAAIVTALEGPPVVLNDPDDDPVVYTALGGGARRNLHGRSPLLSAQYARLLLSESSL